MAAHPRAIERLTLRALTAADAACNRLYGWRYNPLYQSGTIVTALLLFLLVSGLWLVFFYRVGEPYESVARLTSNRLLGNWVRGAHRYASDAAIIAIVVHAVRMFAQGRSWGPRTLAWSSGVVLLVLTLISGWTGYVMVWDAFGEVLAREGARMLDALPILSEPVSRAFTGERPVPSIFFFLTLFAHIGIPLSMLIVLWMHTSRLARPTLLPPRPLLWTVVGAVVVLAIVRPVTMAPEANPLRAPLSVPADWFFAFLLPVVRSLDGGAALALATLTALALMLVPLATRRRAEAAPPKSVVDESICVGCRQCSLDCPYEAITMLPRTDGRADEVARVDPALCVSCGICAGSCPPMGVGPPGRTGRDQLARVREFIARPERREGEVVVICCERGADRFRADLEADGATTYPVDCAGSLHTSVIEFLVRSGRAGVLTLACPPRDCWNREGPRWLNERVYHDREAELQARVDRRRVRIAFANASEPGAARSALREFQKELAAAGIQVAESSVAIDMECVVADARAGTDT
ncbi:MAG: methyl-viologen-reducing hydrogenase subunit delta [Geminicoccaceae bacterium]|nr:methyl-viologen-reducing hydrogenase subunit delta [Geminicoccaceae bacterium]